MVAQFKVPQSFLIDGRRCFKRSQVEFAKKVMVAEALGHRLPEYEEPEVESFVNASALARELGWSRRTMARKIAGVPIETKAPQKKPGRPKNANKPPAPTKKALPDPEPIARRRGRPRKAA